MPAEPAIKRAIAFFDGQNVFYMASDDPRETLCDACIIGAAGWSAEVKRLRAAL